jgi:hypothetical protein
MDQSDFPSREAYVAARIAWLTRRLGQMGEQGHEISPDLDPEMHLAFLEQVYAIESEPCVTYAHQLIARGVSLPHPESLDEEALALKLRELIDGLAGLRVFLENTGHLDDRALYEKLWTDCLNEFTWDMSQCTNGAMHLDLIGSGSEEDTRIWLQYYADDQQRKEWADQFPDDPVPPKKEPVCDRDQELPRPIRD